MRPHIKRLAFNLAAALLLSLLPGRIFSVFGDNPLSADQVVAALTKGNERFATGTPDYPRHDIVRRAEVARGQRPIATVISCSDSRVPPEILFDEGLGDLFIIRVIGNIGNVDETGSAEYGVEHLGTPLLVVLGHTKCGAVTAAVTHAEVHGSIPPLLAQINPAVRTVRHEHPGLAGDELIAEAIQTNVYHSIQQLFARSHIIRERVRSGKLKVIGAIYDLSSGRVNWLGEHPQQSRMLTRKRHPTVVRQPVSNQHQP